MKLLLFTVLYSFSGILFAGNYVVPDAVVSESLSASCADSTLTVKGDKTDSHDLCDLENEQNNPNLGSVHLIRCVRLYVKANSPVHYFYHTRAPPLIA